MAYRIHTEPGYSKQREAMELHLLANTPSEDIAAAMGYPANVVEVYEELFWNVRDRLSQVDFVHCLVLPFGLDTKTCEGHQSQEMRRLAYAGGPHVARKLVRHDCVSAPRPETAAEVPRFLRDNVLEALPMKVCLALSCLDPRKRRDARMILRHHLATLAFEQRKRHKQADPPQTPQDLHKAIKAFQRSLPPQWNKPAQANNSVPSGASKAGG